MYKIAVMGDRDSVMGFKVLGLDVFPVTDPEEGRKTLTAWPESPMPSSTSRSSWRPESPRRSPGIRTSLLRRSS